MKKITRSLIVLLLLVTCIFSLSIAANAQNPYMDLWEHVPDGEPHIFGDRVYVYGSHDVFETRMCGPNYVVWSAPLDDLTNWKYEGISFDGGKSGYLLAPDVCQGPDGRYYLYTFGDCDQANGKGATFAAVADRPEGPFEYLGPVLYEGSSKMIFDPAVLVDDDGKVYLFGASSNIWELDPTDMRTIISETHQVQEVDSKGQLQQIRNFQEGSSIRKVGDWYVFVYASKHDLDREWWTNDNLNTDYYNGTLEYAYSKNIYGPYTYGGVIIDNGGEMLFPSPCTVEKTNYNGNTHGGICQVGDQWYVFYHRQTNDSQTYRQGMCEPLNLTYNDEGVFIEQAEMTSQGAEMNGLNPEKEYSAGIACYLTNYAYVNTDVEMYDTLTPVTNIRNNATVGYKYFNFEDKNYDLSIDVRPNGVAGKIAVTLDDPENEPIAMFSLDAKKSDYYTTLTRSLGKISGKHAVFFNFYAISQDEICDFGSFSFKQTCPGGATQTFFNPGNDACAHSYVRVADSYESTETKAGYRHFKCENCDAEYAYTTDPMVYADGFKKYDGSIVDVNEGNIGAMNPFLPEYMHACDGEPKVNWSKDDGEWRVYLYASYDMKATGYCGPQCTTWSAPVYDLSQWRLESFPNSAMASLAPDCTYNPYNDLYYYVKNMPGEIWVSADPGKGFDDVRVFDESGDKSANPDNVSMFDSALYFTDDGTMYEFSCKLGSVYTVSRLLPEDNYSKIVDHYTIKTAGKPEYNSLQNIYEGPSIRYLKDEDVFILVYASQYIKADNSKWESVLSYAYNKDIDNPEWTYGGIIYDTGGHFTKNLEGEIVKSETPTFNFDNNHGGIAKINGQWYIFGHRNTYTKTGSRQDVAEKIEIAMEGDKLLIQPVEMTSSGLADYIEAYQTIDAAVACYMTPAVDTGNEGAKLYVNKLPSIPDENAVHAFPISGITNGSVIGYKYLNFGEGTEKFHLDMLVTKAAADYSDGYVDGTVDVYLDAPGEGGEKLGSIQLSADAMRHYEGVETGTDGTEWFWLGTDLKGTSGIHAVYFVFSASEEGRICDFDQFSFVDLAKCPSAKFKDAPATKNWAHEGIDYCVANGLMNGMSAKTFEPSGIVTRAQLVTILYRAAGEPATAYKATFSDVPDGQWYSKAIEWASANDIVNGKGNGKFDPMGSVTREQIAAILYRYSGSPAVRGSLSAFPDGDSASAYAVDALVWATQEGLINGVKADDATYLAPQDNATRAQIATIIMRFLEK